MNTQRLTPEFKEVAFKQVAEHGYSVAEVSALLGGTSHSLYARLIYSIMLSKMLFTYS